MFLIPLIYLLDSKKGKNSFLLFFLFSFISYISILSWIPGVMINYGNINRSLSYLALILLAALFSVFWGLSGMLIKKCLGKKNYWIFLIPCIWIVKDLGIEKFLNGFPWCLTGYSQYKNTCFLQLAEFGGIHFITFLVITINVLIYLVLKYRKKQFVFILLIIMVFIYSTGYSLYSRKEPGSASPKAYRAGIIQPNLSYKNTDNRYLYSRILDSLFNESFNLYQKGAQVIIWPEYTVPIYPANNKPHREKFFKFVNQYVPIIAGFNNYEAYKKVYNTVFLFKKNRVIQKYNKVHLAPFGEYIPLRNLLFFVKKITSEIYDFSFSKEIVNLSVLGHKISTPICYEIIFPELIRDFIARGGEVIITISNDSWFGKTKAPYQHLCMAVFRSVENNRYTLRSTSSGISAVISPRGRILYQSPLHEKDSFIHEFRFIKIKTFFNRIGYLFPYLCLLITLIFFFFLPLFAYCRRKFNKREK